MKNTKIYKNMTCAAITAAIALLSSGCYLLPDEEEILPAPTVKASEVKYTTVTAQKKDLEKRSSIPEPLPQKNSITLSTRSRAERSASFMFTQAIL